MNGKDAGALLQGRGRGCTRQPAGRRGDVRRSARPRGLSMLYEPVWAGGLRSVLASACRPHAAKAGQSRAERGQSTVEYALVLVAFLSMAMALAGLWYASRSGRLLDQAVDASSHQLGGGDALGSWRDISLF